MAKKAATTRAPGSPAFVLTPQQGGSNAFGLDSYNQAQAQLGQAQYGYMGQEAQAKYGAQGMADQARYGAAGQIGAARQNARGQIGAAKYGAAGQIGAAKYGAEGQIGAAKYGAQGQKDSAAFQAMANLGVAGQNAMGQYGMNRDTQLTNQAIASANAYGQMANNYYNTLGQLGHIGSALTAAGLNAGAQSASASQSMNMNFGMGGNASFGGGGGGGFTTSGPEGTIARGRMGGGWGGGSVGGNMTGGGGSSATVTRGASSRERRGMVDQGYDFLGGLRGDLNNPNNQAMMLSRDMANQMNATRAATMDPTIVNSLHSQMATGYGALNGLYGMSNYGFNTGSRGASPQYKPDGGVPDYWMRPWENPGLAPRAPGSGMRL